MGTHWSPRSGSVLLGLLAVLLLAAALSVAWTVPGFAGRGVAGLFGTQEAQRDTAPAAVAQNVPARSTQPVPARSRLVGLLGLVAILGIGVALSHNRRA